MSHDLSLVDTTPAPLICNSDRLNSTFPRFVCVFVFVFFFFFFFFFFFCFFSRSHNTEKVIYFLLLDRKKRRPACEDDAELIGRTRNDATAADPPKKRIDTLKVNVPATVQYQLSQGSPIIARRQVYRYEAPSMTRWPSCIIFRFSIDVSVAAACFRRRTEKVHGRHGLIDMRLESICRGSRGGPPKSGDGVDGIDEYVLCPPFCRAVPGRNVRPVTRRIRVREITITSARD